MAKFNEFRYELLPQPVYSPDLAPCDRRLFPVSKPEEMVRRKRFTREQLIAETEAFFEELDESYYSELLFGRLEKIGESLDQVYLKGELKGDYVEK